MFENDLSLAEQDLQSISILQMFRSVETGRMKVGNFDKTYAKYKSGIKVILVI